MNYLRLIIVFVIGFVNNSLGYYPFTDDPTDTTLSKTFSYNNEVGKPFLQNVTPPYHYPSDSIDRLISLFKKGGYYNLPSPLYELSDPQVFRLYSHLQSTTSPHVIPPDTSSWMEIKQAIKDHIAKYGDGALIIISGAAAHIWGAIPELEKDFGIRYISVTPRKLTPENVKRKVLYINTNEEALDLIGNQMKRSLGVVKYLGYDSIEAFLQDRTDGAAGNIVVGIEETGLHEMYSDIDFSKNPKTPIYEILKRFIDEIQPTSILYIGEDLCVETFYESLEKGGCSDSPLWDFIRHAVRYGIPIEFGKFG